MILAPVIQHKEWGDLNAKVSSTYGNQKKERKTESERDEKHKLVGRRSQAAGAPHPFTWSPPLLLQAHLYRQGLSVNGRRCRRRRQS